MSTKVQAEAKGKTLLGPVEWVESVPSTNTELLRRIADDEDVGVGHVLAARTQTAGRGRQQRVWQSMAGRDLTFSFFQSDAPPERMVSLPMAVALSVVDLLSAFGIRADTKWPNDVLVGGRKICGLLAETAADARGGQMGVVVGVGLNVDMSADEGETIDHPVTSIRILTEVRHNVENVLADLLPLLNTRLAQWQCDGFTSIRLDWQRHAVWMDQPVELQTTAGPLTGIVRGYGDAGELLLEVDGQVQALWSAELMRRI